ncbi:MAG: sulfite exporter TauE/SafE family protein [Erysipelotrichaceae bacterium]|nr:sulfite exporter TauE/SafE family protein [Erysipelotrichaceae bacterium]
MKKIYMNVGSMKCEACETRVEKAVKNVEGVKFANADCTKNSLIVEYEKPASEDLIKKAVISVGYEIIDKQVNNRDTIYILVIILGLYIIVTQTGLTTVFQKFPVINDERVGYAFLFIIGLLTSVHCVAMCSGINLAQSVSQPNKRPVIKALSYNFGRLMGYTIIGGVLGLIGEEIAITLKIRGIIGIIAGMFMVMTGINMLGNFGFLKKITFRLPKKVLITISKFSRYNSFAVGIVNAFMPCGPLQSMQLYAIACGSMISGALSMFFFCLGTIPLMFMFSLVAGVLEKKAKAIMLKVSAVLVMVFGIYMLQNNFALTGISLPSFFQSSNNDVITAMVNGDKQYVTSSLHSNGFDDIKVQAGIPVVWTLTVDSNILNGCNNEIVIAEYDIEIKLYEGENTIEFIPKKEGTFTYTCWMGMLKNTITVV